MTRTATRKRSTAKARRRTSPVAKAMVRVMRQEALSAPATDLELAAATKLANGLTLNPSERRAAVQSGMFGNAFSGATVRARYDAAQTTTDNKVHWAQADALDAVTANSPAVRRILRSRARHEVSNNSYAKGMILTLANDLIGTGPRLQLLGASDEVTKRLEAAWADWAGLVDLAGKLRTMVMAKSGHDGEAFAVFIDNPGVQHDILLDLQLVEADRVANPYYGLTSDDDGITFDAYGNPVTYSVLKEHPGSTYYNLEKPDYVPASQMLHWFRRDRPGQIRGIPEITPALPLFAQLRRYTLATLAAAETAADNSMWMKTPASAEDMTDSNDVVEVPNPFDLFPLTRNMVTQLPDGYDIGQFKPEQPVTTYGEFKAQILNEIARCLNMPYNIAAGNSSNYNYSSGRLDHQTYFRCLSVDRHHLENTILDRILKAWLREAELVYRMTGLLELRHQWFWEGREHVDPEKEANAQATRLRNHTTTLAVEYARQGRDWETELRQRAKEVALMKELGLPVPGEVAPAAEPDPEQNQSEEQRDGQDQDA